MTAPLLVPVLVASGLFIIPITPPPSHAPRLPAPVVRSVELTGNRLLPTPALLEAMSLPLGQEIASRDLERAVAALNRQYLSRGYAFCGVLSGEQLRFVPSSGTLRIEVIEPRLRAVRWVGTPAGEPEALMRRAGLAPGQVLEAPAIQRLMLEAAGARQISPPRPHLDEGGRVIDLEFTLE